MSNPSKLERQKAAIKNLIQSMLQSLPPTIQMMISCYRGMIDTAVDRLTEEQLDDVIRQAKDIINVIEGDNGEGV